MRFTKMQGCGNDYIYVDGTREEIPAQEKPALVRRLSDRHFGIGGDGVIFINEALDADADFEMEMYNADGSRGAMCGNGIRCVGAYVYVRGLTDKRELTIVSAGAGKQLTLEVSETTRGRMVKSVTVDMGAPILSPAEIPVEPSHLPGDLSVVEGLTTARFSGRILPLGGAEQSFDFRIACLSMGNPHAVVLLPAGTGLESFPVEQVGRWFETHPAFPDRVNTEFVCIDDGRNVRMRVWERGAGETLSCGTGCCAVTVACALLGLTQEEVTVHVRGGALVCRFDREKNRVYMTGPAEFVFDGEIGT